MSQLIKTSKQCSECKETKDLEDFYHNAYYKDGYAYRCILCHKAAEAARRKVNRESERITSGTRHCTKCLETKDISQFNVMRNSNRGFSYYCKKCLFIKNHNLDRGIVTREEQKSDLYPAPPLSQAYLLNLKKRKKVEEEIGDWYRVHHKFYYRPEDKLSIDALEEMKRRNQNWHKSL